MAEELRMADTDPGPAEIGDMGGIEGLDQVRRALHINGIKSNRRSIIKFGRSPHRFMLEPVDEFLFW